MVYTGKLHLSKFGLPSIRIEKRVVIRNLNLHFHTSKGSTYIASCSIEYTADILYRKFKCWGHCMCTTNTIHERILLLSLSFSLSSHEIFCVYIIWHVSWPEALCLLNLNYPPTYTFTCAPLLACSLYHTSRDWYTIQWVLVISPKRTPYQLPPKHHFPDAVLHLHTYIHVVAKGISIV